MRLLMFITRCLAVVWASPYTLMGMVVGAAGLATFALYGLDKRLARTGRRSRVPEHVLNVLSLGGGFLGAWLGRAVFHHKTNPREHGDMYAILVAGTLAHAALVCLGLAPRG